MAKLAIIGSGIAGLGCAWWLEQCGHDVTVYAGGDHIGGHSHTVAAHTAQGPVVPVDTGFMTWGEMASPNLMQLFGRLNVPMMLSDMSCSFGQPHRGTFTPEGLGSLLTQPMHLVSPQTWQHRSAFQRFGAEVDQFLADPLDETLEQFLVGHRFSETFFTDVLQPLALAFAVADASELRDMPAQTVLRHLRMCGVLHEQKPSRWLTVDGGSIEYLRRLACGNILPMAVSRVRRHAEGPIVEAEGSYTQYDQVIMACHADTALSLLADPTADERKLLSCFSFAPFHAVLHQDPRLMPKRGFAWASYNLRTVRHEKTSLTCWLNQLQDIPDETPLFLTFNSEKTPKPELTLASFDTSRFVPSLRALMAQHYLGALQGVGGLWYCGAWMGYGLHEDGLTSGLAVAEAISGAARPWAIEETSPAFAYSAPHQLQSRAA